MNKLTDQNYEVKKGYLTWHCTDFLGGICLWGQEWSVKKQGSFHFQQPCIIILYAFVLLLLETMQLCIFVGMDILLCIIQEWFQTHFFTCFHPLWCNVSFTHLAAVALVIVSLQNWWDIILLILNVFSVYFILLLDSQISFPFRVLDNFFF
jgi:hypothetical protein